MKHGCGLVAATDWTRTDQGLGLCADVDWSRTSCGHGQFTDWTRICLRTACERGLCADTDKLRSRSRTGHGHGYGQDTVTVWTWTVCGHGHAAVWSRTGHDHGHHAGHWRGYFRPSCDEFADNRALRIQGVRRPLLNSHKSCEPSRINMPAGYGTDFGTLRHLAETFLTIQTH